MQGGTTTPSPISYGNNAVLTDDPIANIIFNEPVSLSGLDNDEVRLRIAHLVINADEALGANRLSTVSTASENITRQISPAEMSVLMQIRQVVQTVRTDRAAGIDPTNGAQFFNFRDPVYLAQFNKTLSSPRFGLSVQTSLGPLNNSLPTPELGSTNIYFTVFK